MFIRFVYTVDTATGVQLHELKRDIEVAGKANTHDNPTYKQLGQAEQVFRSWFLSEYGIGGKLMAYTTKPFGGSVGMFSEYQAFLPVN
jgi:hypothetical protein